MQISYDNSASHNRGARRTAYNPKLFSDLEAQDWMADDEAEERERQENEPHGAFQPSAPSRHQFSLAEHMALFAKLQSPVSVAFQIRFSEDEVGGLTAVRQLKPSRLSI
jgi:hypothetical protein